MENQWWPDTVTEQIVKKGLVKRTGKNEIKLNWCHSKFLCTLIEHFDKLEKVGTNLSVAKGVEYHTEKITTDLLEIGWVQQNTKVQPLEMNKYQEGFQKDEYKVSWLQWQAVLGKV